MKHTMDWLKRLYDHEESPPPESWDVIRDELTSHPSKLGRRLREMEAEPPSDAWGRIKATFERESIKKPAEWTGKKPSKGSVRSLPSRAFAYAASLAGIGLFLSALYWYQTDNKSQGVALGGASPLKARTEKTDTPFPSEADQTSLTGMEEDASDSVFPLRFTQVGRSSEPGKIELCDKSGHCVAVSSKMKDLTETMGPALNASASKAVKSRRWNRTLRKWQRRLQDSKYLPNPGNLFDIGQLAELLNERP